MRVSITARPQRGFWRGKIFHTAVPVEYDVVKGSETEEGQITEKQLKLCQEEPMLVCVEVLVNKEVIAEKDIFVQEDGTEVEIYRDKRGKFSTKKNDADGEPEKVKRTKGKKTEK